MNRREMVIRVGALLVTLPLSGRVLLGCASSTPVDAGERDDAGTGGGQDAGGTQHDAGSAQDAGTADAGTGSLVFTSSVVSAHSHELSLERSLIAAPPAGGVQRDTSLAAAHLHQVTLTEAQLQQLASGGALMVVTTVVAGHDHSFELRIA